MTSVPNMQKHSKHSNTVVWKFVSIQTKMIFFFLLSSKIDHWQTETMFLSCPQWFCVTGMNVLADFLQHPGSILCLEDGCGFCKLWDVPWQAGWAGLFFSLFSSLIFYGTVEMSKLQINLHTRGHLVVSELLNWSHEGEDGVGLETFGSIKHCQAAYRKLRRQTLI